MQKYLEIAGRTPVLIANLIGALALLFVVFPALPIGGELLDAMPAYTHAEAIAAMESYGESGRLVYAWSSLTLDVLLPIVYVSFLAGFLYRFPPAGVLRGIVFLPFAAGLLDLAENVQLTLMLTRFPDVGATQVALASWFTMAKTAVAAVSMSAAVVFAAVAAVRLAGRRLRGRPA
ncbi:MAG: hypothetical protein OXP37_01765 [Chloroflexota bacterium]|nr:hypothetical protein [Chloroflexota bacterium]MDE2935553.1 hypothetical protein [Chloroflexota bacterium]